MKNTQQTKDNKIKQERLLKQTKFIEDMQELHKKNDGSPKYDYSKVEYINNDTKVIIVCLKEGHGDFLKTPKKHKILEGCQKCTMEETLIKIRKPVEKFIEDAKKVHSVVKYDYSRVHEDYENNRSKIKIGCLKCKIYFSQIAKDHILKGVGCKNCKNKTHQIFYAYLREKFGNEFFESEKKFDECKFVNYLPFDFYSKELNLVIELDGRQHFVETGIFRDTLAERQFKDFIKMKYLQENNISLIRIFQEDVLENRNNWKVKIISNVHHYETPQFIYLSSKNNYEDYEEKYNEFLAKNIRIEDLSRIVRLEESAGGSEEYGES